ncbi:cobaltochelatase subunit CobN [Swingsia samuiensis]|uniref:Cobaltochelatase subunit CobN n=1 Tax=Swingsia samuiensis TaxID=1293412 RepID=A0A4Y6UJF2_9PROT|nr:cobaltochelatase subunit CobN [Swingsia samuiensis]QDH17749.1 cobaltochelatase subunit CobN [Swingsia samuiensis]
MHLLVRERHGIDDQEIAEDLGHEPTDIVFLSFSDSDLLALDRAYEALSLKPDREGYFSFRSVNLARLRHPMSVDLYLEQTLEKAHCVVVRLLGGVDYWKYGAEELRNCSKIHSIPLALLPGDAREDLRLEAWSNIDPDFYTHLRNFLREGGPYNAVGALKFMAFLAGKGPLPLERPKPLPVAGVYRQSAAKKLFSACIVFYRAHLLSADVKAIDALSDALENANFSVDVVYVASLKNPDVITWVTERLNQKKPDIIVNATFFSAQGENGAGSPYDATGVPVIQVLQPTSTYKAWEESTRGLSQSDLAMQVALPELDGRILSAPISFKSEVEAGGSAQHIPYGEGIKLVVQQALGWVRLKHTASSDKRLAVILSDYPGAEGQIAHAVGLDTFSSLLSILYALKDDGYDCGDLDTLTKEDLIKTVCNENVQNISWSVEEYKKEFQALPISVQANILDAWGSPEDDTDIINDYFQLNYWTSGKILIAIQPDRGSAQDRKIQYHDPDVPPRHAYVAFYMWLRRAYHADALVHLGTHGTLEWLPGKAVALSEACMPLLLRGGLPVLYPFIVNNPGEAAAAKRRLGAITIGHMTPPVMKAGLDEGMVKLEQLIEEFAEADGLDRRRGTILRRQILEKASSMGVLAESGVKAGEGDEAEALARLDAYLCDVKDLQIRDGLHVFGQAAPKVTQLAENMASIAGVPTSAVNNILQKCGEAEMKALLDGLSGRFVSSGPSGAPTRGRLDVLPTGRNLYTMDPRAVPTASALELARVQANQLLLRHLQEEGEPLSAIVIDVWGASTLRTGGEDLALALLLMGVTPTWDTSSGRVSGVEVIPLAALDRPRVDVTLRISGLFRDAFPAQIALFDQAVQAIASRDETEEWNPLAASLAGLSEDERKLQSVRIFGSAPGTYGTGIEENLARGAWQERSELGQAYLAHNDWMYGGGREGHRSRVMLEQQLKKAEAILHVQDHAEVDILEGPDMAASEGGLAVAAMALGAKPSLWHGDTSQIDTPRLREMEKEVARIVRGRLANPKWIEGMRQHDYRGAAEIARGVEGLCAFAAVLPARFDQQFDLVFDATLGDEVCDEFLLSNNPQAHEAIRLRFCDMIHRGLWQPKRNSALAMLEDKK